MNAQSASRWVTLQLISSRALESWTEQPPKERLSGLQGRSKSFLEFSVDHTSALTCIEGKDTCISTSLRIEKTSLEGCHTVAYKTSPTLDSCRNRLLAARSCHGPKAYSPNRVARHVMRATSVFTALAIAAANAAASDEQSLCSCGFQDPASKAVYTESLIVYFNETDTVDSTIFTTEAYEHRKEKGWTTTYRQGAVLENVAFGDEDALPWQDQIDGNSSSLELWTNPSTPEHLVNGAQLRSVREDILYGSFRAEMRSAQPWIGGSALTFALKYNDSSSLSMDMCNQNNPEDARITNLVNGEWPEAGNGTLAPLQPWDFVTVGFDWNNTTVDFYVGKNRTRTVTSKDRSLPMVPQPLYLWHWSSGDPKFMMGPPSNVRWVRAFFNSSLMSDQDHQMYDQKCNVTAQCSTDDNTLRISTAYSFAASKPYQQPSRNQHVRWIAGVIAAVFSSFGVATLINAVIRREPWKHIRSLPIFSRTGKNSKELKKTPRSSVSASSNSSENLDDASRETSVSPGTVTPLPKYTSHVNTSGRATPAPSYRSNGSFSGPASRAPSATVTPRPSSMELPTRSHSQVYPINSRSKSPIGSIYPVNEEDVITQTAKNETCETPPSKRHTEACEDGRATETDGISEPHVLHALERREQDTHGTVVAPLHDPGVPPAVEEVVEFNMSQTTKTGLPAKKPLQLSAPPKQQRIDYLSGFLVFSCLGVTLRHFSLTFWPYVTVSFGPIEHFEADQWLAYILGPYLLTPLWIGPFFVTSCRFLASRYLKNGKLSDVANKILLRGPRMLLPCFIFMILEYFLLELGLTGSLEWLPSVSCTALFLVCDTACRRNDSRREETVETIPVLHSDNYLWMVRLGKSSLASNLWMLSLTSVSTELECLPLGRPHACGSRHNLRLDQMDSSPMSGQSTLSSSCQLRSLRSLLWLSSSTPRSSTSPSCLMTTQFILIPSQADRY
nr:hypothetical protein CFP56_66518 [Quercus suber]